MCSSAQTNSPHRPCLTPAGHRPPFRDAFTGLSPCSPAQLLLATIIDPLFYFIMRVFTWADQKKNIFVVFFLFVLWWDLNAKFSNDEQKGNGDIDPHEDKIWPLHGQLWPGGQRAGQVSFQFPLMKTENTPLCVTLFVCFAQWDLHPISWSSYVSLVIILDLLPAR